MGTKQKLKVPFDGSGNLMSFPEKKCWKNRETGKEECLHPVMKDNYEFNATLTYHGFDKGTRAAHRLIWIDEEGHTYPMFVSTFGKALSKIGMLGDKMTGRWTFQKRGQNFSVCPAKKQEELVAKENKDTALLKAEVSRLHVVVNTWIAVCSEVLLEKVNFFIRKRVEEKVAEKLGRDS